MFGGRRKAELLVRAQQRQVAISAALKEARRATALLSLTCLVCRKPIIALRSTRRFCSNRCRVKSHRVMKAAAKRDGAR